MKVIRIQENLLQEVTLEEYLTVAYNEYVETEDTLSPEAKEFGKALRTVIEDAVRWKVLSIEDFEFELDM